MTHLSVDPAVLIALKSAQPKPPKNPRRLLTKLVGLLAEEIELAKQRPRSYHEVLHGHYTVDISRLYRKGGQFGDHGLRLLTWLRENKLDLFTYEEKGSNFTHRKSKIKLSHLVEEILPGSSATNIAASINPADTIEVSIKQANITADRYLAMQKCMDREDLTKLFHSVPVDMESLQNYINNLDNSVRIIPHQLKSLYASQAAYIKQMATRFNGHFQQYVHESKFGRKYYKFTSIQNINKELRSAVLGDCWEYDVSSSATAWKLSYAPAYLKHINSIESVEDAFSVTIGYLTDKPTLMGEIQDYTFAQSCFTAPADQSKRIKEAMNALCFGARLRTKGWRFGVADDEKPALCKIFKDDSERTRFVNCPFVKQFVREQNNLDTYLYQLTKSKQPEMLDLPFLRTAKRPSKSKVVALLYQTAETENMGKIYQYLATEGIEVLAKVHDAFFVRQQLTDDQLQVIESEMKRITGITYFKLHSTQIHRCSATPINEIDDVAIRQTPTKDLIFQIEAQISADELSALGKRNGDVDMLYAQGGFCT